MSENIERERVKVKPDKSFEKLYKELSPEDYNNFKQKQKKEDTAEESESRKNAFIKAISITVVSIAFVAFFGLVVIPAGAEIIDRFIIDGSGQIAKAEGKSFINDLPGAEIGNEISDKLLGADGFFEQAGEGWENFRGKVSQDSWDRANG